MQRHIGQVTIESMVAETPKFTAPMLLVHGLWCAAPVWHKFMGYLAHRGWSCHALNLRGRRGEKAELALAQIRFTDYRDDVRRVIDACEAPPVLVGHDLGGLLALTCATSAVRAIVAVAPLMPRSIAAVPATPPYALRSYLAVLRARPLRAPRGKLAAAYFGGGPPGGTFADSGCVVRELASRGFPLPQRCAAPALVLAGESDPFCPPTAAATLARHCQATVLIVRDAGHAMPWERGWEQRVSDVHRWLVRTLGEALLALPDAPQ